MEEEAHKTYALNKIGIILGVINMAIKTGMVDDLTKYCMVKHREYRKLVTETKEE
jgi:hypothetical protein